MGITQDIYEELHLVTCFCDPSNYGIDPRRILFCEGKNVVTPTALPSGKYGFMVTADDFKRRMNIDLKQGQAHPFNDFVKDREARFRKMNKVSAVETVQHWAKSDGDVLYRNMLKLVDDYDLSIRVAVLHVTHTLWWQRFTVTKSSKPSFV